MPIQLESSQDGFFFLCMFLIDKKDGGIRPNLDLGNLNISLCVSEFQMVFLLSVLQLLKFNFWLITVDLKDAYFHISIHM